MPRKKETVLSEATEVNASGTAAVEKSEELALVNDAEPKAADDAIDHADDNYIIDESATGNTDDSATTIDTDDAKFTEKAEAAIEPQKQKQHKVQAEPMASVLTIDAGAEIETQKDKENAIWHEIKNSQITGTHLTGTLGKLERLESGTLISIVDYKGQRIVIPLNEMMLELKRPAVQSDEEYNERVARVLNRMMGAEIDFVVRGITVSGEERAAVASRKAAMLRLRRRYYLTIGTNGKPQIYPDRIVEARIVAVSQLAIRVEIFGVEAPIRNRDLSWGYVGDCRDKYFVGDSVQVRVKSVVGDAPENLSIRADIKSLTEDNTREKLLALKPQTNCMGKVTDVSGGVVFINLVDGIRAIAHKCFDRRKPGRGDDVVFVCTRIDEDGGVAIGIISRIVKRNI